MQTYPSCLFDQISNEQKQHGGDLSLVGYLASSAHIDAVSRALLGLRPCSRNLQAVASVRNEAILLCILSMSDQSHVFCNGQSSARGIRAAQLVSRELHDGMAQGNSKLLSNYSNIVSLRRWMVVIKNHWQRVSELVGSTSEEKGNGYNYLK